MLVAAADTVQPTALEPGRIVEDTDIAVVIAAPDLEAGEKRIQFMNIGREPFGFWSAFVIADDSPVWVEGRARRNSENSKANRIETMKGPAEFWTNPFGGSRKIAKKIAKNKRCYANTLRPRSRMLLKVMKGG